MQEADRVVADAYQELPRVYTTRKPLNDVFRGNPAILRLAYEPIVRDACAVRRKGHAQSRAEALEMAFDFALRKTAKGWERTGEVHVDRKSGKVQAFCINVAQFVGAKGE